MRSNVLKAAMACLVVALLPSLLYSAEPATATAVSESPAFETVLSKMDLADGDTLVFLGDSITHQCLYTQYVEDFFYTRFPDRRIHFHNAGVGGDRASDALVRFDEDVAKFSPKYVTILLGMNDGSYRDFDQGIFETYRRDMTSLLDEIDETGAVAIPMTPTMHDARAARMRGRAAEPRDTFYNGVLALYGAWLREVAQVRGLGFVDMYSPLNNLTLQQRKTDATFTMIPDAVHPAAPGQVVMAASILADICPRGRVSAITIQEKKGQLSATAAGGKIANFEADDQGVRFTFTADALPWVVPEEAKLGYDLLHAGHHYSMEAFTARNLAPGKYELKIDGQSIGTFADTQLAFRLELEANDKTPQYQQALAVAMLNKERNDKAVHPLRDCWGRMKGWRRQIAQLENAESAELEAKKEQFAKWRAEEFDPSVAKYHALADEYEARIYEANQPPARRYELVRVH